MAGAAWASFATGEGAGELVEQSSYSSHMPFSVSRNSKPMHHEECSLSALLQAWSQSASVDLLPRLPLPSSWSANTRLKSWSDTRRQRAVSGTSGAAAESPHEPMTRSRFSGICAALATSNAVRESAKIA